MVFGSSAVRLQHGWNGTNGAPAGWLRVQVADERQGLFLKYPVVPGGWREVVESSDSYKGI